LKVNLGVVQRRLEDLQTQRSGTLKVAFSAGLTDSGSVGPFDAETTLVFSKTFCNVGGAYDQSTGEHRCVHGSRPRTLLLQLHRRRLPEGLHRPAPVPQQPAGALQPGPERPRRLRSHVQRPGPAAGGGRRRPPAAAGQLPSVRRRPELQLLLRIPVVPPGASGGAVSRPAGSWG
ncbi:unnamed protein product, partial [Tetraodon nigroviridis]